jgi:hypothetical protein
MWSQFPPNLSCLQNNPPENNVEPVPAKSELPPKQSAGKKYRASSRQIWAASKTIRRKIMWSQFLPNGQQVIWDLAGTGTTLFSSRLFWDWFFLDFRIFFGACFRYKLMYYNLYHMSDLRKIILFLCKIVCIEFECNCNEFLLVLVQIDLIHIEHSSCISSTWTKNNTNL